ncbi:MAG: YigZ family protein [Clostridia bacterium]|nr:YigZ family protein [Clostridia bacterium]
MSEHSVSAGELVTLAREAEAEIEEKRSRFIAGAVPVSDESEARAYIDARRKKHYAAKHHVFAYMISEGSVVRYSDDGEPQGTGGIPVLNVLRSSGATDFCVVVTRYFGGILLGTGGLSRAYAAAARAAVDLAGFAVYRDYSVYEVSVSYPDYRKLSLALQKAGALEDGSEFGECVRMTCSVLSGDAQRFERLVTDVTNGKALCVFMNKEKRRAEN